MLVVVEVEQVLAVTLRDHLAATDAVGDPQCMPGAWITGSRTSRSKKPELVMYPVSNSPMSVASQAKPFGIGIGAADEREHLDLAAEVGAVVGEHVHEVVLRETGRRPPGRARKLEAAAVVHVPDLEAERVGGQLGERLPPRLEPGIDGTAGAIGAAAPAVGALVRRRSARARRSRCARRSIHASPYAPCA